MIRRGPDRLDAVVVPRAAISGSPGSGLGKNRDTPPSAQKIGKLAKSIGPNREYIRVATASRLMVSHYHETSDNLSGSSVCGCGRWRAYGADPHVAEISVRAGVARMLGHFQCKAVWSCEHCAKGRVAQTRSWIRAALIPALDARDMSASLLTFTLSHKFDDDWGEVVDRLLSAFTLMDRRLVKTFKKAGSLGKLRALEAPIGSRGIHPHLHVLLTHDKSADLAVLSDVVGCAWRAAVTEVGGSASVEHGFDFKPDCINDYLAKLETSHELASQTTKDGYTKGKSLAQLLDRAARGDEESGKLWLRAQKALGGKRRFHAGGLSKKLGIVCPSLWEDEKHDAEVKAEKEKLPDPTIIRYPQISHMKATDVIGRRAGLAIILRSARSANPDKVFAVVNALCKEHDEYKNAKFITGEVIEKVTSAVYKSVFDAAKTRLLTPAEVPIYLHAKTIFDE